MPHRSRALFGGFLLHIVVLSGALLTVLPFGWMIISSFKNTGEIFRWPPWLLPETIDLFNYVTLFTKWSFGTWYLNSIGLAVLTTLAVLFFSSLAGFGFAKYNFRGKNGLFILLIGSTMIPFQLILIPLFIMISRLGWVDTYVALVVPFVAPAFGIFLMRQFATTVPTDLLDAARMDGASEFGIYRRVVLPLIKPALGTLAILTFLGNWNSFLWPLVVLRSDEKLILPIGLANLSSNVAGQQLAYGVVMAAATLVSIPVVLLFLAMQKQYVAGLTLGSIKM
ncbi:carbohydrate ABC transporter permease [Chloroflexi bacterium TSY]|nr:carbohydrate ABC transporter permease [Chloroflexi bacterium TSY]